eukprot:scaffold10159_cov129-Amphora_coffeaeformis.AAC.1
MALNEFAVGAKPLNFRFLFVDVGDVKPSTYSSISSGVSTITSSSPSSAFLFATFVGYFGGDGEEDCLGVVLAVRDGVGVVVAAAFCTTAAATLVVFRIKGMATDLTKGCIFCPAHNLPRGSNFSKVIVLVRGVAVRLFLLLQLLLSYRIGMGDACQFHGVVRRLLFGSAAAVFVLGLVREEEDDDDDDDSEDCDCETEEKELCAALLLVIDVVGGSINACSKGAQYDISATNSHGNNTAFKDLLGRRVGTCGCRPAHLFPPCCGQINFICFVNGKMKGVEEF